MKILLCLLSLLLLAETSAYAQSRPDSLKIIGKIIIHNRNVFDPRQNPKYAHFPYPLFDRLHFKTRPHVIRQELLFHSGEHFNKEKVDESARNLRKFSFLGYVNIKAVPRAQSDTVDVVVTTEDQWTTNPDVVLDRRGGLSRMGIGIEEENLLGFGKYLNVRYEKSTDRTLWRTIYNDPRLLGSHWALNAEELRSSEGDLSQISFTRPLYALSTPWSFHTGVAFETGIHRLYDNAKLSASVLARQHTGTVSVTHAWKDGDTHQELTLGITQESLHYPDPIQVVRSDAPSTLDLLNTGPEGRQNLRTEITWSVQHIQFVERRLIDRAGLIEDIRLGPSLKIMAGWAHGLSTRTDAYGIYSVSLEDALAFGKAHLLILSAKTDAHVESKRLENGGFFSFLHYYYQGLPAQTFAFGLAYNRVWKMDQPYQLVLGEDVGLRGYPARQFTGNRLFLMNFEDRVFTPLTFATMRVGFAAFFDAGMVWRDSQPARWQDLRTSVGVSLRLAVIKSGDAPVFRLDVAFPLRRAPGVGLYSIGFSFSPVFWSFRGPDDIVKPF